MLPHHKINYVEFPAKNMAKTKLFFAKVFGWKFQDYGPDYCSFMEAGIDGGFFKADMNVSTSNGSVLIVIYSESLEQSEETIIQSGGKIVQDIFDFPGGRRFHFTDPNNNEFAVWSDK
jgi:predicted enzyme related to lactoylglutathione lyase